MGPWLRVLRSLCQPLPVGGCVPGPPGAAGGTQGLRILRVEAGGGSGHPGRPPSPRPGHGEGGDGGEYPGQEGAPTRVSGPHPSLPTGTSQAPKGTLKS